MSQELMRAYCADRFTTGMAANYPAVKLKFENVKFIQPATAFVEMNLDETHAAFASTGSTRRFYRTHELLSFILNWPENAGTKQQAECAEYLKDLFQGRTVVLGGTNAVTFHVGKLVTQGLSNGFYRKVVMIPCWRDQSKPPPS